MLDMVIDGLNGLNDALEKAGHDIGPALETALDVAAKVTKDAKTRRIGRTYARPIPTHKNGSPKWKRTGHFAEDLTIESTPGERVIVNRGPSEAYEERLALLDRSADGVMRANSAAEDAYDDVEPKVEAIIEQALLNALGY